MKQDKLAIVIPYYKIDFFEATIKSIAKQTDKRFSLYIGNDASPNDPISLILKYFPNGRYKYFEYKDNLGKQNLALQWERILTNVEEEWFQILGDDDILEDNFVEEFYKTREVITNNINLIRVKNKYYDDKLMVYKTGIDYNNITKSITLFEDKLFFKTKSTLSENIFRKKVFDRIGFRYYPIAWHTDDMLIYELTDFDNYYYNPNTSVKIYNDSINLSGNTTNLREKFKSSQLFLEDLLCEYKSKINKKIVDKLIRNLFSEARNNSFLFENKIIYTLFIKGYIRESYRVLRMNIFIKKSK